MLIVRLLTDCPETEPQGRESWNEQKNNTAPINRRDGDLIDNLT
jgi:hypothetical protein